MKMQILFVILVASPLFIALNLSAQVGINTNGSQPDPSSGLDVNFNNKGMLMPRMTQNQISAITTPANGLIVFCTTDDKLYLFVASANIWKEVSYGTGTIATYPSVTTTAVTNITLTTAISGGNVTSDGGATVTARGVCWSTSANPTTADNKTTDGTGTGVFISDLTELSGYTLYYVRAYATNIVGTSYGNQVNFTTALFTVGQSYGGGIIFYIDGTGQHGLISATSDQSTGAEWGCYGILIGGTSYSIGSGQANTTAIVNGCSTAGIAARICETLSLNGYTDWFLPSREELVQMYLQKSIIGGFANAFYWCSTEGSWSEPAWFIDLSSGVGGQGFKYYTYYVRAVRAF